MATAVNRQRLAARSSQLARLIHYSTQEMMYSIQQEARQFGVDWPPVEKPAPTDVDSLLKDALAEAFEHGSHRLKQAAIFQVHGKFRRDEASAVGMLASQPPTPVQNHELSVLRSSAEEIPWEYLTCKYERLCTDKLFVDFMEESYNKSEIENFIAIAEYYERCIEAKDWVALGWQ